MFDEVKVFSATKARDREELGDKATEWLRRSSDKRVVDVVVKQSSDHEFHCLTLVFFLVKRK